MSDPSHTKVSWLLVSHGHSTANFASDDNWGFYVYRFAWLCQTLVGGLHHTLDLKGLQGYDKAWFVWFRGGGFEGDKSDLHDH
jgi:hypothetical protein